MKTFIARLTKNLLLKIAAETVLIDASVEILRHLSQKTSNTLDDKLVALVANALVTKQQMKKCDWENCHNQVPPGVHFCSETCLTRHYEKNRM